MRQKLIALMLCVTVLLAGCGAGNNDPAGENPINSASESETVPEGTAEETGGADMGDGAAEESAGEPVPSTGPLVYASDSLVEVAMGSENGEASEKLCSVKIGADYLISGKTMDSQGVKDAVGAAVAPLVEEVALGDSFVTEAVARGPGDVNDEYVFMVAPASQYSVSMIKEHFPDGYDVKGGEHAAYITGEGRFDALFIYELNDEWVLVIEYDGALADQLSMEEMGQAFYQLITPVA